MNNRIDALLTKELVKQTYEELGNLKAVAKKLGVSTDCISRRMKKFGLDYKHKPNYGCDHSFFSSDTENSFYVAGFIAADGCVRYTRTNTNMAPCYQLNIGLSQKDKAFL